MGLVKIDDSLHEDVRRASAVMCRSINAQAEFWMKIGMLAEANPALAYTDIVKMQLEMTARDTDAARAMAEAADLNEQVAAFFADYLDAFARKDAGSIAEMWDEVALFSAPGGNFAMDRDAFRSHCETLLAFYAAQGVSRPTGDLLSVHELLPGVAQARMAYRMIGADGVDVAAWEHVYILRNTDGAWRVSLTLADDEMAAWAAAGAQLG